MKIAVLNGSPKGKASATMKYVAFLQQAFAEHEFVVEHISLQLQKIEGEQQVFEGILERVGEADMVLWATPVYVFLVPSQLKRFIELVNERKLYQAFAAKPAAVLTTSIHFYDHTAITYLQAVCEDWDMRYIDGFSADMYDITKADKRDSLKRFFESAAFSIARGHFSAARFLPRSVKISKYRPGKQLTPINAHGKRIVVIANMEEGADNVIAMVQRFQAQFSDPGCIELVDLAQLQVRMGCLGCLWCGFDGECTLSDKDEFLHAFHHIIGPADILVFADRIRDHYLTATFKRFIDRTFVNGHRPFFIDKQVGFLISGPLSQNENLREMLTAHMEVHQASLVDIICDEGANNAQLDSRIASLANRLVSNALSGYLKPMSFLGVGGRKIFRDDIWGRLRVALQADHVYYRAHGFYDFPHKNILPFLHWQLLYAFSNIPKLRKGFQKKMRSKSLEPMEQALIDIGMSPDLQ